MRLISQRGDNHFRDKSLQHTCFKKHTAKHNTLTADIVHILIDMVLKYLGLYKMQIVYTTITVKW